MSHTLNQINNADLQGKRNSLICTGTDQTSKVGEALDSKGHVQYNCDAGTSLHCYKLTMVRVDFGTS
jgi:hypothetical protein